MKFSQNGLSLIEVIMSMWIVGLIVFSTMVCTSDIETKMDQRKIQALSLAKSELDKLRYWALKGFLMLNEGSDTESTRNYTMIVWALDRKKVKFDFTSGQIVDIGEKNAPIPQNYYTVFDTYNYSPQNTGPNTSNSNFELGGKTFTKGNFINEFQNRDNPTSQQPLDSAGKEASQLKTDLENYFLTHEPQFMNLRMTDVQKQQLFTNLIPFVLDVRIDVKEIKQINTTNTFLYNIRLNTGWFEKRGSGWGLSYDAYSSKVISNQSPTLVGK